MRLALLINDIEFRAAFARSLSESGSEILLDLVRKGESIEPDALIITDAEPADIEAKLLNQIQKRTVFLVTDNCETIPDSYPYKLFKYSSVSRLLADISDFYHRWKGSRTHNILTSRVIACCSDSDAFSGSRCTRMGRQIAYRKGGRVIILPLGYINEHSVDYTKEINNFARMMYRVRKGRIQEIESLIYTDAYGISRLMIPSGRNPVAYLEGDDLHALIKGLSMIFDSVILDMGGCYRPENLTAINNATYVICFETGRKRINFSEITGMEGRDRIRIIKLSEDNDEDMAIDEYIDEIYRGGHENG